MSTYSEGQESEDASLDISSAGEPWPDIGLDVHIHTASSDGPPLEGVVRYARGAGLDYAALADHANLTDRDTMHDVSDWDRPFTNYGQYDGRANVIESYNRNLERENVDPGFIEEYVGLLPENYTDEERDRIGGMYGNPLQLIGSAEIDYESGEDRIEEFHDLWNQELSVVSAHMLDLAYIKNEDDVLDYIFEERLSKIIDEDYDDELENDRAREIISWVEDEKERLKEVYFDRMVSAINMDIADDRTIVIAHPDLIERNAVLNHHTSEEDYRRLIDAFADSSTYPELPGKGLERQVPEEVAEPFKEVWKNRWNSPGTWDLTGDARFVEKSRDQEFYTQVIKEVDDSEREALVRSIEKEDETVFMRMLLNSDLDFVFGSDAHREWEIASRKQMAETVLDAWKRQPLDRDELLESTSETPVKEELLA